MKKHILFLLITNILPEISAIEFKQTGESSVENLFKSCRNSDLDAVKSFINSGGNINAKDKDGNTPLHIACYWSSLEIVKMLVENGAYIDAQNSLRQTPLKSAEIAQWIRPDIYKFIRDVEGLFRSYYSLYRLLTLLEKWKINCINIKNEFGQTLLHKACCNYVELETVKFLIEKGADINLKDKSDQTPFNIACKYEKFEIVEFLISKNNELNLNVNIKDAGKALLYIACTHGNLDAMKFYIAQGISVHSKYSHKTTTLLSIACKFNHFEIVKFLIENNVDINCMDCDSNTPLYTACKEGNLEIVQLLLPKYHNLNSCLNAKNRFNNTALHLSCESGNIDLVQFLFDNGANIDQDESWTPLHSACVNGSVEIVKLLIEKYQNLGISIDIKADFGHTPLFHACRNGFLEIIELLIENGADVNVKIDHGSPLIENMLYHSKNLDVIKLLISKGADIRNALHSVRNDIKTIELLIDNGADINARTPSGGTPLHFACMNGNIDVVEFLISKCADISGDENTNHGHTILHGACFAKHLTIAKYLIEKNNNLIKKLDVLGQSGLYYLPADLTLQLLSDIDIEIDDKYINIDSRQELNNLFPNKISDKISLYQNIQAIKKEFKDIILSKDIEKIKTLHNLNIFFTHQEIADLIIQQITSQEYKDEVVIEIIRKANLDYDLSKLVNQSGNLLSYALYKNRINLSLLLIYLNKKLLDNINFSGPNVQEFIKIYKTINTTQQDKK